MYAPKLIRVISFCNRNLLASRQLLISQKYVQQQNVVVNLQRFKSNVKSKNLTKVLFSPSTSPDANHIVSKGKSQKKRRRVISSDSSSDENGSLIESKTVEDDAK